jgi:hypothetical protein
MHDTRTIWLPAARSTWFSLTRHDDPEPSDPTDPEPGDPEGDPEPSDPKDPEPEDQLGDAGKRALQKEREAKAAAKKEAAAAKRERDDLARKVAEFEDRDKSELEKATSKAEAAAKRAEAATSRAVRAEVKALAGEFADVDDALVNLNAKMASYAGEDGEIDIEAIKADLEDVLDRKPHLKKQAPAPEAPKAPRPDPSQGPRKEPAPVDYRNASRAEIQKAAADLGVRLR